MMPPQAQPPAQNPLMAILAQARQKGASGAGGGMAPSDPDMQNPMSKDQDSGSLLVNRSLLKNVKVKPGDTITVTGKVTSIGNKIGFAPAKVEKAGEKPEDDDDDKDEDLEAPMGSETDQPDPNRI